MTDNPERPATRRATAAKATAKPAPKAAAKAAAVSVPETAVPAAPAALELYLLRHADAGDSMAWTGDDAERPLSAKGRRQSKRLGRLLADLAWRPDNILTSPKLRATQTARLVGRAVATQATDDDRLAFGFDLEGLRLIVGAYPDARRVVLVGHDPDFSSIASTLIGAPIELRKGAIARIDLLDRGVAAGSGVLRWLVPPDATPR